MGRVLKSSDYTFNKTAKTITFSSVNTGLELSQIQLITDVTNSTVIYQFNKTGYGGTLVGLVLTLQYDTTGGTFNNSDNLMIIIDDPKDNSQLYSSTLSATGTTTSVDTTDFQTLSIQLSGNWEGIVTVEGSNNSTDYVPLMVYPVNEFSLIDNINEDGIYTIKVSTKFVRLNVVQLVTGSVVALIQGRTISGPDASDAVASAMDKTQKMPLLVEEITGGIKKDINNAIIPSDIPDTIRISKTFNQNDVVFLIDTTGYQSLDIVITQLAINNTVFVFGSNDGSNWSPVPPFLGISLANGVPQAGGSLGYVFNSYQGAPTFYNIPVTARYIRAVCQSNSVAISLTIILRNKQANTISNIPYGTPLGNNSAGGQLTNPIAGAGGIVSGQYSHGSFSVNYPVIVGGRQAPISSALSGITRSLLTDSDGRVQVGINIDDQAKSSNTQLTGSRLQVLSGNMQNGNSLNVTDLSQLEGQSMIEILSQILIELKINNQYLYELPTTLQTGKTNTNEPSEFRNEPSAFNI